MSDSFKLGEHYKYFDQVYTLMRPQFFFTHYPLIADVILDEPHDGHSHTLITYHADGMLDIHINYDWGGLTGFFDLKSALRASLIHDALLELIANGKLHKEYRKHADRLFRDICKRDGTNWFLVQILYAGVTLGRWKANVTGQKSKRAKRRIKR